MHGNGRELSESRIGAGGVRVARGRRDRCVDPGRAVRGLDWSMTTALHGIRLQVVPDDAERAKELLAQASAEGEPDIEDLGAPVLGEDICPALSVRPHRAGALADPFESSHDPLSAAAVALAVRGRDPPSDQVFGVRVPMARIWSQRSSHSPLTIVQLVSNSSRAARKASKRSSRASPPESRAGSGSQATSVSISR